MKKSLKLNQEKQFPIIFVLFATLLGLVVRITVPLQASFPLNDGGLFYAMIQDIQQNGYALPAFTSYNFAYIPLAYPPFAFYLTGLFADLIHINLLRRDGIGSGLRGGGAPTRKRTHRRRIPTRCQPRRH